MTTIETRNDFSRVVGASLCPVEPTRRGLSSWTYPWKHMQPGHMFILPDPSPEARAALASSASIYGRRHGMKFSTGVAWDRGEDGSEVHVGWWCIRHDGCEVLPPEPTLKQRRAAEARAEIVRARQSKAIARKRPPRAEPPSRIGDYAPDVAPVIPEAPTEEADEWLRPVVAGEVF